MKKLFALSLLLFAFSNFYSQIIIEKSDYVEIGDEIKRITYSFSDIVKANDILTNPPTFSEYPNSTSAEANLLITDPSITDVNGVFTEATFAYLDALGLFYYKVSGNKVEILGYQGTLGSLDFDLGDQVIDFVFPTPIELYTFPLSFEDTKQGKANINMEFVIEDFKDILIEMIGEEYYNTITNLVKSIKIEIEININIDFDEFGSIGFSGNNVINGDFSYLRENRKYIVTPNMLFGISILGTTLYVPLKDLSDYIDIGFEIPDLTTTITSYNYWTKEEKYPLAEVLLSSTADTVYSVSIRHKDGLFNSQSGICKPNLIFEDIAFPNPATDCINFNVIDYINFNLHIYSLTGNLIEVKPINEETVTVDLSIYNSGNYVYKIFDKNGIAIAGGRFIKQK